MNPDNVPKNTPPTSVPNPPWIDFVMDIWLILGVISLLLALWFIPSNWRSTGLLMLGYGLMFITSSVMLRRHLPKARTTTVKPLGLFLLLFLYCPALLSGLCFTLMLMPMSLAKQLKGLIHVFWQYHYWLLIVLLISHVVCIVCAIRHRRSNTQ